MASTPVKDKWTAFLMSLIVPGSGQLFAGSGSCLVWFVAAGCLIALLSPNGIGELSALLQIPLFGLFSIVCAEHAKRCLEHSSYSNQSRPSQPLVTCYVGDQYRVKLDIEIDIYRPCQEVWKDISDVRQFIQVDPFHISMESNEPEIQQGVAFRLIHRAFGLKFLRVGKILKWQEGQGYAFSDLPPAGGGGLFPHVFFVSVSLVDEKRSCLRVQVRGKWTRPYLPRLLVHLWLRYVCREHARLLAKVY